MGRFLRKCTRDALSRRIKETICWYGADYLKACLWERAKTGPTSPCQQNLQDQRLRVPHAEERMDAELLAEIETDLHSLHITQYTIVATACVVIYEYLITLDNEIRHMWSPRFTFARILFFVGRYLPLAALCHAIFVFVATTNMSPCRLELITNATFSYVEYLWAVLVLFTRSYAIWANTRIVTGILAFTYVGSVSGASYAFSRYLSGISVPPYASEFISHGCAVTIGNNFVWVALIILIFCEILAVGLLLAKSLRDYRQRGGSGSNLLTVMTKDGVGYFICNLAITIANLIVLRRLSPTMRGFLLITQGALQNILCNRLLLHIHVVNESRNYHVYRSSLVYELNSLRAQ
ncbi:hypothetical protein SCHPADRAFT_275005 [Schizopora paradoxa]|uniref:DUF6533 domain-containing protein n=1 Tax=Schizopora paradoxa TaxID=27342 RepID=A0A0H2RTE5_9AGAM|nr:hypothetical protein SCHPADRAFT_275005 [Schizopora paradoxa]